MLIDIRERELHLLQTAGRGYIQAKKNPENSTAQKFLKMKKIKTIYNDKKMVPKNPHNRGEIGRAHV